MIRQIISKLKQEPDYTTDMEYLDCVSDLIVHPMVRSMQNYTQHGDTDCLEHCLYVSYSSYLVCKRMGLDYRSAARGGILHDFFLYDWHIKGSCEGLHGFIHPRTALQNANKYFCLSSPEKDIIAKHMWPMTIRMPEYRETFIVIAVDKYCAFKEIFNFGARKNFRRVQDLLHYQTYFFSQKEQKIDA